MNRTIITKNTLLAVILPMVGIIACSGKYDSIEKRDRIKPGVSSTKSMIAQYFSDIKRDSDKKSKLMLKKDYVKESLKQWGLEDFVESVQLEKDYNFKKTAFENNNRTNYTVSEKDEYILEVTIPLNIAKLYKFNSKTGKHDLHRLMRVGTGGRYLQTPIGNWRITGRFNATPEYIGWSRTVKKDLGNYDNAYGFYLDAKINRKRNFNAYMIALHNFPDFSDGTEFTNGSHPKISPAIGESKSGGCVRIRRSDSIYIKENVPVGTRVNIDYETVYTADGKVIILDDIYCYKSNTPENVIAKIKESNKNIDHSNINHDLLAQAIEQKGKTEISSLIAEKRLDDIKEGFSLVKIAKASEEEY